MSELKVYHCNEWHNEYTEFYMKSEADKVIAELESKLDIYKRGFKEDDKIIASLSQKLRHQKYKRCLAMAFWCSAELGMLVSTWESKIKFYKRWHKRWLELANKFKEV